MNFCFNQYSKGYLKDSQDSNFENPSREQNPNSHLDLQKEQGHQISSGIKVNPYSLKIRETIISFFNTGVSEAELLKKKIRSLSSAAFYRHCSNLQKKGTNARKFEFGLKSFKTKEWINELTMLLIEKIRDLIL